LQALWKGTARERKVIGQDVPAQYMVLVLCRDEKRQVALLERFAEEGLEVKALLS
jgi:hypothetical protein